jgi:hypothetical protein
MNPGPVVRYLFSSREPDTVMFLGVFDELP